MPSLAGFEAWVEVDGARLLEFEVDALEGEPGVICWVPCEVGKAFTIGVTIPEGELQKMHHKVRVRLDGTDALLRSNIFQQCTPAPTRCFSDQWVDAARSATRAFEFGTLQLTDDDDYLDQCNENLGQIEVSVQSVESFVPVVPKEGGRFNDEAKVHERSKKALATCVRFGETRPRVGAPPKNFASRGVKDVCTFVFKYRTLDVLIANEIAPRELTDLTPVKLEDIAPAVPTPPSPTQIKRKFSEKDHEAECESLRRTLAEQKEVKKRKKYSTCKARRGTKVKPSKRARVTPSWSDDSDEKPSARPEDGFGFRLLSPLRR